MKNFFVIISCLLFINATLDSENIELDIDRLGENSLKITWSINYEEYDRIVLEVLNQNNAERTRYILPSLKGAVELCCFEGDVGATITITKSIAVDKSDEDCSALTCIEYEKEDYFNSKIVTAFSPNRSMSNSIFSESKVALTKNRHEMKRKNFFILFYTLLSIFLRIPDTTNLSLPEYFG